MGGELGLIGEGIRKLVEGRDLKFSEAEQIMVEILSGEATQAQIGGFLVGLRMKGVGVEEVAGFASVMRRYCERIYPSVRGRIVDTCGTGGDRVKTFNVSTAAAFVVAGAGIYVAKHGNRSVTSNCGSADVLEELGFNLNVEPKVIERMIERVGIGFMYAPRFHPSMKVVAGARREIGIRTVFNILGPLTNPAGVDAQVLGVYDADIMDLMVSALKMLGVRDAMVVHGLDGLDEISIIGKTRIEWLRDGELFRFEISPRDFGFRAADPSEIRSLGPRGNAEMIFKILYNILDEGDPRRNIVLLNAAAGIVVGGGADDLTYGLEVARESIESGSAYDKLMELIKYSGGSLERLEELEGKYA